MGSSGPPLASERENISVRAATQAAVEDQEIGCHTPENGKGGHAGETSSASARDESSYPGVAPASVSNLIQLPCTNAAANNR